MAVIHSGTPLVTAATTIGGFSGTLRLLFRNGLVADNDTFTFDVYADKLEGNDITLPAAQTAAADTLTYAGFTVVGSSKAFTRTTALNVPAIITDFYSTPSSPIVTINDGYGKIDIDNTSGENNLKNAASLIGTRLTHANLSLETGAILFTRALTGATQNFTESGTQLGSANVTITGGTGTALLSSSASTPAFSDTVVRLDELNYPFNILASENVRIEPIGSSVLIS